MLSKWDIFNQFTEFKMTGRYEVKRGEVDHATVYCIVYNVVSDLKKPSNAFSIIELDVLDFRTIREQKIDLFPKEVLE